LEAEGMPVMMNITRGFVFSGGCFVGLIFVFIINRFSKSPQRAQARSYQAKSRAGGINSSSCRGFELLNSGQSKEAIAYFDKALYANPTSTEILENKAFALYKLGRYDEALDCCNQALAINPKSSLALDVKDSISRESTFDDSS
jgi:tetratricopeptide (TPR) repeat protein